MNTWKLLVSLYIDYTSIFTCSLVWYILTVISEEDTDADKIFFWNIVQYLEIDTLTH
jgi:hypothetical protein